MRREARIVFWILSTAAWADMAIRDRIFGMQPPRVLLTLGLAASIACLIDAFKPERAA